MNRFVVFATAGWLLMATAIVVSLMAARHASLSTLDSPAARQEWDTWRASAAEQASGKGPVQRKIPKSLEPPALVLMRDYFGVAMTVTLVLSTCLYFTLAWMLHGVTGRKPGAND